MRTNVVYNMDCIKLMQKLPEGSVDLILTDLPYGETTFGWDVIIPLSPMWENMDRILKDNGSVVMTAKQPFTSMLIMSNLNNVKKDIIKVKFKYELIWIKDTCVDYLRSRIKPIQYHEDIIIFSKGNVANRCNNPMTYNPQGTTKTYQEYKPQKKSKEGSFQTSRPSTMRPGNYKYEKNFPTSIIKANNKNEKKLHPTQKPINLFEYLIKTYSNEEDVVMDCCAGSGTTAISCLNTNRQYILTEKDKKYYDIIKQRIDEHSKYLLIK